MNTFLKNSYIQELEEKIKRLEANKKLLLEIIEVYDEMLKTSGCKKSHCSLLDEVSDFSVVQSKQVY